MAEVLLLHHAQGLTPGVRALADVLRHAGHVVHTPDLYEGRTFDDLESGVAHAREVGFDVLVQAGVRAAQELPAGLVYAGMSLGVLPAQLLAQTREGARGALLLHAAVPLGELAPAWPEGVPAQVHTMADDAWGDVAEAGALAEAVPQVELFLYPGDRHLFADESLPDHDPEASALLRQRVLSFLEGLDRDDAS